MSMPLALRPCQCQCQCQGQFAHRKARRRNPASQMGTGYIDDAALCLAVAVALLACRCAAQGQAPAPAPEPAGSGGSGCMPELVSLSPCMGYMSGNATAPEAPCCAAVSGLLGSSPRCLCVVLGGTAATLGVAMDGARALRLPAACRVQPPPASQCDSMGVPMSSPATPFDPNVAPAGSGSKATPTIQNSHGNVREAGRVLAFVAAGSVAAIALIHCA